MDTNFRTAVRLTIILGMLAIIVSIGGLSWDGLYRDSESIKAVWFVNDLVTLILAVPLLLVAMVYALRGSIKAHLVWIGGLWYLLYNYVFYLYGAQFNNFFLLYALLFPLSACSLVVTMSNLKIDLVKKAINEKAPLRAISIFLFIFALALGVPWIAMALGFKISNQAPPFEMTIVFATDLSFLVSVLIISAILLWKRNPWGVVLAAMIMLKGLLYPLVLIIGGAIAYSRTDTWDSFIPLYFALWISCAYFYRLLLKNID